MLRRSLVVVVDDGDVVGAGEILRPRERIDYRSRERQLSNGPAAAMASITIRNLDDETKERLRVRAAYRRRSMEEEARSILREALDAETTLPRNLAKLVHDRFAALGGVDLEIPVREPMREPPQPNP